MTGHERTMAAIRGGPVDRAPFDFWAEDTTLNRLYDYLGHSDLETFLDEMDVDIRGVTALDPPLKQLENGVFQNMWGERFIYNKTPWGDAREDTFGALHKAESLDEIMAFPWPDNDDINYSSVYENCRRAKDKKLAVRYGFADIWQRPALVRGLENHLIDMALRPDWAHYMSRVFTDFYIEEYRRAWEVSAGMIDIFLIISDAGTQRGPLISRGMFDTFIAPYLQKITDEIHRLGAKVMYHSCGDISAFIPSIINCGVDILDPIQPVTENMSPKALKQFSGRICFHGGIDVQRLLPFGTIGDIKRELIKYVELLGPGYIAGPAHLFQSDTPAENIIGFYKYNK